MWSFFFFWHLGILQTLLSSDTGSQWWTSVRLYKAGWLLLAQPCSHRALPSQHCYHLPSQLERSFSLHGRGFTLAASLRWLGWGRNCHSYECIINYFGRQSCNTAPTPSPAPYSAHTYMLVLGPQSLLLTSLVPTQCLSDYCVPKRDSLLSHPLHSFVHLFIHSTNNYRLLLAKHQHQTTGSIKSLLCLKASTKWPEDSCSSSRQLLAWTTLEREVYRHRPWSGILFTNRQVSKLLCASITRELVFKNNAEDHQVPESLILHLGQRPEIVFFSKHFSDTASRGPQVMLWEILVSYLIWCSSGNSWQFLANTWASTNFLQSWNFFAPDYISCLD